MVKTCKVKVDKKTYTLDYDTEEFEELICELNAAKKERNAFECIHCKDLFPSKERLNGHRLKGCHDITGKPLKLRLYPSVRRGGRAEVKEILEKRNQQVWKPFTCIRCKGKFASKHHHKACDVIPHGSPIQLLWEDGSKLPDVLFVTPIVYKEHPESHEVSFLVMDGLSFSPVYLYQEELDKEDLSMYRGKGLFDLLRQKANKALCVASVAELEDCTSGTGLYPDLTACASFSYQNMHRVILDSIVEANAGMVNIADVPSTIWATMTGFAMGMTRVMNIIIMGRHEDCEAEGERWISWGGAGSLEGHMKSLTPQEQTIYVGWVQDLLWNCNNLIISRRGLLPKSVVPSCFPSVSNSLDGCQDMHNLKEVLVTQQAKSQDSSERCKRKSLANGSPGGGEGRKRRFGNSSGNEDIINITRQQQPDGEQFTRVFRLKSFFLSRRFISILQFSQEHELIVVAGYLACLAKIDSNFQQEPIGLAGYLAWNAKKRSIPLFSRLLNLLSDDRLIKWPVCLDKFHQASDGM